MYWQQFTSVGDLFSTTLTINPVKLPVELRYNPNLKHKLRVLLCLTCLILEFKIHSIIEQWEYWQFHQLEMNTIILYFARNRHHCSCYILFVIWYNQYLFVKKHRLGGNISKSCMFLPGLLARRFFPSMQVHFSGRTSKVFWQPWLAWQVWNWTLTL